MASHSIYGLTVSADLPFNRLPESSGSINVEINSRRLPAKSSWGDDEWDVIGTPRDRTFFWIEAGVFNIRNGRKICYDSAGRDEACVRDALLGECMGVAMIQRGDFVLHASVVSQNGRAAIFCGESGLGKSSLASCLVQDGWCGLSDDLAVIRHQKGEQLLFPGYPQFNLYPNALNALGIPADELPEAYSGSLKKAWSPQPPAQPAAPAAIFVLQQGEQHDVTPLGGTMAVVAVLENTFAAHLSRNYETPFLDHETERIYLAAAAALVESCSIHTMTVPPNDFSPTACRAALADYLP